MKYRILAEVLGQSVEIEGEVGTAQTVHDIVRELLGHDKEVKEPAYDTPPVSLKTALEEIDAAVQTEPSGPVQLIGAISFNELRSNMPPERREANEAATQKMLAVLPVPTVDDVADAVREFVARLGAAKAVPKATALLQEFGAAHAKGVPEDKRAAFIARLEEVTA